MAHRGLETECAKVVALRHLNEAFVFRQTLRLSILNEK